MDDASPKPVGPRWLLPTAFLVLAGALAIHRIDDSDFWLHLATGKYILQHQVIPQANLFSFTHPDHSWHDVYWLYQVVIGCLWQWGGAPLVVWLKLALVLALATLVLFGFRPRHEPLTFAEGVILLPAWLLLSPRLTDRPELVSFGFLAAMLILVRAQKWWWCIPLQVIWANVQGYFYWGPLMLALLAAGFLVQRERALARSAGAAAIAAGLACAISPFGWRNWGLGRGFATTFQTFHSQIDELASPFHPAIWTRDGSSVLFVLFMLITILVVVRGRRSVTTFDWLLMLASLPPAVVSQRAIPVFVLCALPAVLRAARRLVVREKQWMPALLAAGLLLLAIDFVAGTGIAMRYGNGERRFGWQVADEHLPRQAVMELTKTGSAGLRVLNLDFHTGGYLLAVTNNQLPVFIDGRLEAYPPGFIRQYLQIENNPDTLRQLVDQYDVSHVLVVKDSEGMRRLGARLGTDPSWRRVYQDHTAEVFVGDR